MLQKHFYTAVLTCFITTVNLQAQTLKIKEKENSYQIEIQVENKSYLKSPEEGLWSIATQWKNDWPANWQHAQAESLKQYGDWEVLKGKLSLPEGDWHLQDAYKQENGKVKCIRRYEWRGKKT